MASLSSLEALLSRIRENRMDMRTSRAARIVTNFLSTTTVPPEARGGSFPLISPTQYSSRPPGEERPLERVSSRPAVTGGSSSTSGSNPISLRPSDPFLSTDSVVKTTSEVMTPPRASTFGDLIDLTLSLRPR